MALSLNVKIILFIVSFLLLGIFYVAISDRGQSLRFFQTTEFINPKVNSTMSPNRTTPQNYFHVVSRGTNIQVGDLQLHLTTAVHYDKFPAKNGFNVFLNGWVREKTMMDFKCCLMRSLDANKSSVVEVKAFTYHVYSQWVVDMQNGEFSCSLSKDQLDAIGIPGKFSYVTFVRNSCLDAPRAVLPVVYPKRINDSVAICLKISYGTINPELIVEWFEYVRLLGVTRISTFLSKDLDEEARNVFMYYKSTGFLDTSPINPARSKNGPERGFRPPRFHQQAWVDEVMASNDCKHRMSGFDYIIVMDLDELIIPTSANGSYLSILKKTSEVFPNAGTFSFDSHVIALNWNLTRKSPAHIMSTITRTTFVNYDGADRNTRWAFMPHRTFFAQNNKAWQRKPFTSVRVPNELYILIHRRKCKRTWTNCENSDRKIRDPLILKYEERLLAALKQLPLSRILPNNTEYVNNILAWKS